MNIPANSNSAAARATTAQIPAPVEKTLPAEVREPAGDTFSPMPAQILRDAITAGPPIRADKVAYAKQLLADPNYPPVGVLKQIASQLVTSAMNAPKAE